jgi:hypothetical protein
LPGLSSFYRQMTGTVAVMGAAAPEDIDLLLAS